MTTRKIQQVIDSVPASDGAGVKLRRSLGSANHLRADPFLMLAARPLKEPVLQYGPFVMNTRAETEQAIRDYQNGVPAV